MPVRYAGPATFASQCTPAQTCHVRGKAGVSRPEEFHQPASRRTVREPLDSHRSHQVNVFVPNAFQCTNSPGFSRASFRKKRLARVLWD
ncbi:hypothetical protein CN059_21595 [Sinorhizobium medicae]|nr:hypothetical protein CN059_21595 [Sinorhizobium medicae]